MSSIVEYIRSGAADDVLDVGRLEASENSMTYFRFKERALRPVGALLFMASLPVLLLLMLLVKVTSPGPAIYRQRRLGKEGREFVLYKLRTMYVEAEKLTGPVWSQPRDSRITPIGRLLRLLHLDELPQLWNVARGDMDLVGPRPERPEIVRDLIKVIPDYLERVKVLPGITGLAQINLGPDRTYDCVRRKLTLDREYIDTANLWMDARMIVCTALRMVGMRHGRAVRWLGLQREAATGIVSAPDQDHHNGTELYFPGGHVSGSTPHRQNDASRAHGKQQDAEADHCLSRAVATKVTSVQTGKDARRHVPSETARPNKPR